ncbi:MAG: hypothetical protein LLG00_07780 [Planctomycetaceae bacterium]|nr:hypothetical protein [Planctomycetaceae bacterium]
MPPSESPEPISEEHSSDRRGSYRFPAADALLARLVVGEKSCDVQITDESAGGFGVRTCEPLEVNQGDVVQLRTDSGWFELRVARVEQPDGEVALGLERIRELPMVADSGPNVFRQVLAILAPSIDIAQLVSIVLGLMLAVAIVGVPVLLNTMPRQGARHAQPWIGQPTLKQPVPEARPFTQPTPSTSNRSRPWVAPPMDKWQLRLVDLQALTDWRTVRDLSISPQQQREIVVLLKSLSAGEPSESADAASTEPLINSVRRILTADQLRRLQVRVSEKAPPATPVGVPTSQKGKPRETSP